MKKQILVLLLLISALIPASLHAQAHLGITDAEIMNLHPDKTFQSAYTNSGQRYIYTAMQFGTFYYYFDKSTQLSVYCMQVPGTMQDLNSQVEIYNQKYASTSKNSWTAYLDGGGVMYITLRYAEDIKGYYFYYTQASQ